MPTPQFLHDLPRYVFFTGKGGVGKTSLATATAISLADAGKRVLLVSTDPASNVAQVLRQPIGNQLMAIAAVPGLTAIEIDPEAAAHAYRESVIGPFRGLLPEAEISVITEQLSGSCTTEIASFNEFTGLLADDEQTAAFDHVIFDTAPTGHTIRLLQLPGEWTSFLDEGKGDASCLGPLSGLARSRSRYAAAVQRLGDPRLTRLVLVARADFASLAEVARSAAELADVGMRQQHLVINGMLGDPGDDALAQAIASREAAVLGSVPKGMASVSQIPLKAMTMVGVDALRGLLADTDVPLHGPTQTGDGEVRGQDLEALVDELVQADHGLIMCMGKGGVGKSTIAAALALALADRGAQVHLSTTDPAGNLELVLSGAAEDRLDVSRVDPEQATARYREKVLATKGARLDEVGRAQLIEDLRSPCTEEVAVFAEFSQLVALSRTQFVVLDTAPTGHTLLLMDATGSYHREILRGVSDPATVTTPLMRLQDPDQTKVLIITLPDATPVQEAAGLDADLRRAGITPWGWVVNQAMSVTGTRHPLLQARAVGEREHLDRVASITARRAIVPTLAETPTGLAPLRGLTVGQRV